MKTLIAVPCMDMVAAPFAQSLATLKKEGECLMSFMVGSLVYESRNKIAAQALVAKTDYVLWLDSDMTFPQDLIPRMIKHMEDGKEIVTGLYFRRRSPFTPVLFKKLGKESEDYPDYPRDSVFEVEGCGFGCVMLKTAVLEDVMLNKHNWFEPIEKFGEDLSFCIRARELGHKIYCDSSIKCGHVGQLIVNEDVYQANIKE